MRKSLFVAAVAGVATLGFWASPSIAQDDTDQKFGTVHFATSCNETAQRRFDRAMRYQHSFWYKASREIFEETLKADPTCGIAYWGMALGLLDNLCKISLLRSLLGVKRTCLFAPHMSANDPKRTSGSQSASL